MDWLTFISSIVGAIFAGGVVSLVVPWSRWGVEKSRKRRENREKLLDSCRIMLNDYENGRIQDFRKRIEYLKLKSLLDADTVKKLDAPLKKSAIIKIDGGDLTVDKGQHDKIKILAKEIKRLENKWKLI